MWSARHVFLGMFLIGGLLFGCRRHVGPQELRMRLLTDRPWKYQKYTVNGQDINPPTDRLQFRPDGTSVLSDGSNTTEGSRWEFVDDGRELRFNSGTQSETTVEIVELSNSSFEFKGLKSDDDDKEVPFEAICVH